MERGEIKTFAGFTIGPIYETLSNSRKTRELWFASFFFSWFMEKIIEELSKNNEISFITPYVNKPFNPVKSTTGMYPDRFILYSSLDRDELFKLVKEATEKSEEFFIDIIDDLVKDGYGNYIDGIDKNDVREIFSWYIQKNFVVFDFNKDFDKETNIVSLINRYLDSMEERRTFRTGINKETCFVCKTLPALIETDMEVKEAWSVYRGAKSKKKKEKLCPICFLKYHSIHSTKVKEKVNDRNFKYPPLTDIAAVDLINAIGDESLTDLKDRDYDFEDLKKIYMDKYGNDEEVKEFVEKTYLKYFAIIQADGDNLGKIIGRLKNFEKVKDLSKSIFEFSKEAKEIIESFRGYPIYIGGDDILAFSPVAFRDENGNMRNVIELAKELHSLYKEKITKFYNETSISIGITISYYKFPLSKALENTRYQLFNVAKKMEGKNGLSVQLIKHSGCRVDFSFKLNSDEINMFTQILSDVLSQKIKFPSTIHHNLSRFRKLISFITTEERFDNFFDNNFNEPIHKSKVYSDGINQIKEYFKAVLLKSKRKEESIQDILNKLSFIKFLKGEETWQSHTL